MWRQQDRQMVAVEHDSNAFLIAKEQLVLETLRQKTLPNHLKPLRMLLSRLVKIHGNHGKPTEGKLSIESMQ